MNFEGAAVELVCFEDGRQNMLTTTVLRNTSGGICDRVKQYAENLVRIDVALPAKLEQPAACSPGSGLVLPELALQTLNLLLGIFEALILGFDLLIERLDVVLDRL